ncbi:hypothetical protein DE146DRAFT_304672 [Phaeosphaeria sp. MPI-PUGE-AT-0046c]|nr:hypothetical protein DE146DRAFT_304672 [Phaeosphaeria sp. MPI-PUGE-AT-0046c]
MLSHVSLWRMGCFLRHHFATSTCQASLQARVLRTAKFRIKTRHSSKTLVFARTNHNASRSKRVKLSVTGSPDPEEPERSGQSTLISEDSATTKLAQDIAIPEDPIEAVLQEATDSIVQTPDSTGNLDEPSRTQTAQTASRRPTQMTHATDTKEYAAPDSRSAPLLPFVQNAVSSGNLYNPRLASFIKHIESREERIIAVRQIISIAQSLVAQTGKDLELGRRKRPSLVGKLQTRLDNARACLHGMEALTHRLGIQIAEIEQVTSPFEVDRQIENRSNWNVSGIQQSTRHMTEAEKERNIDYVLRALETEISLYRKIGTKSNLKSSIENLSSLKSWLSSLQKQGSLCGVVLEPVERPNRFTGLSYPNKTEEIEDVKNWQATQKRDLSESSQSRPARVGKAGEKELETFHILQRRRLKALQVYMASLYLEETQLDDLYPTQTEQEVYVPEEHGRVPQIPGFASKHGVSLLEDLPNVPFRVVHYILGQVLYEVQREMFAKGQHQFETQLQRSLWHSVESIPILDFVKVMKTYSRNWKLFDFCEQEVMALRVLRNAHAHQVCDFDVRQLRGLISSICIVLKAISPASENWLLHNYRKRLMEYEQRVIPKLLNIRQAAGKHIMGSTTRYENKQKAFDLARATLNGPKQIQRERKNRIDVQKTESYNLYRKATEKRRRFQQKKEQNIMMDMVSPLQDFAYEMQVRHALHLLPSSEVPELLQKLQGEYSIASQLSKSTKK